MHPTDETEPQRRRRGSRALALGCGAAAAALTTALFGYVWWANSLPKPEEVTRVLPTPNGYDACNAAVADLMSVPAGDVTLTRPLDADLQQLRRELAPRKDELDEVRRTLELPFLTPSPAPKADFLRHASYRNVSLMFAGEARLALAAGDRSEALQRSLDAVELGVKFGRGAPYLHSLVGFAIQAIGVKAAERCFGPMSAEDAQAAGRRLDGILKGLPEAADVVDEDRRIALNELRSTFAGRVPLASSAAAMGGTSPGLDAARDRAILFAYPKAWGYRSLDQYYRAVKAELQKPYATRTPVPPLSESDPVIGGSMVEVTQTGFQFARTEAMLFLLRVRLALEEYRARHRRLPRRLEELTPEIMSSLPEDPFSGKPLRYVARGDSFQVYSVGPDLKDDSGTSVPAQFSESSTGDYLADQLVPSRPRAGQARSPRAP